MLDTEVAATDTEESVLLLSENALNTGQPWDGYRIYSVAIVYSSSVPALSKSDRRQMRWSGDSKKQAEIIQKTFQYLFGKIDDLSIPLKREIPEVLGTVACGGNPTVEKRSQNRV